MAQSIIQTQSQQQSTLQTLSPQQLLQVKILELPINELEERVKTEMDDNPALEVSAESDDYSANAENDDSGEDEEEDFEKSQERDDRQSELDNALSNIGSDDEMPTAYSSPSEGNTGNDDFTADTVSFFDQLKSQMAEHELTDKQRDIIEYLIGSLDDDGLLRKSVSIINDELAVYHNLYTDDKEIEEVLSILQDFDPAGVGARTLQECLLIQINRRDESRLTTLMREVIENHFDDFTMKHWKKIQESLKLNDIQSETLMRELRKLNPKPGASLGETVNRNMQQITPDFIVDTLDDGTITFSLNNGDVPELNISQSFADTLRDYQKNKDSMSRTAKEALLYTKNKVDAAQGFIDAIKKRKQTLYATMKAIIGLQKKFFEEGDEGALRPMILKDVADKTGYDLSTISRVSNSKFVQTRWGTYPLKFFFNDGYTTDDGKELSTHKIKLELQDIIDNEDKRQPLSDDALKDELARRGLPIARRTVAKYREQLGIPVARLRR
jgi:RNA polymerase sigma-54 factor